MNLSFHEHLRYYDKRKNQHKDIEEKSNVLKFFLRLTMLCVLALQSIIHFQLKIRMFCYDIHLFRLLKPCCCTRKGGIFIVPLTILNKNKNKQFFFHEM